MELSDRVGPYNGQYAYNMNNFFSLVVNARRLCLNLHEEQTISVH